MDLQCKGGPCEQPALDTFLLICVPGYFPSDSCAFIRISATNTCNALRTLRLLQCLALILYSKLELAHGVRHRHAMGASASGGACDVTHVRDVTR